MRRSAAHALGETGSELATEPLIKELLNDESDIRSEDFNSLTFPTLVDVLSEMGDRRIVKPTLQRLGQFRSQAIRLQLLRSRLKTPIWASRGCNWHIRRCPQSPYVVNMAPSGALPTPIALALGPQSEF